MINIKEFLDGFLALIRFLTQRAFSLAATWVTFDWVSRGKLSAAIAFDSPTIDKVALGLGSLFTLDVFIGEQNRQTLLFAALLLMLIGAIYLAHAMVLRLGSLVPIGIMYTPGEVYAESLGATLGAWRYYAGRLDFRDFGDLVAARADELVVRGFRGWSEAFQLLRSWLPLMLIAAFVLPLDGGRVGLLLLIVIVGLVVCAFVEGRSYRNDLSIAVKKACRELIRDAKAKPVGMDEVISRNPDLKGQLSVRRILPSAAHIDLFIPLVGSLGILVRNRLAGWRPRHSGPAV